jgi:hypothetical protein
MPDVHMVDHCCETVFRHEMGKPINEAMIEKLLALFQEFQIAAGRSGRVGSYQV